MKRLLLISLAGMATGCASIAEGTNETSERVLLTSTPSGASVRQQARTLCTTPCYVRRSDLRNAEGFEFWFPSGSVVDIPATYEFQSAILGNIVFGGGVGLIIDTATGRVVGRPDHVHAEEAPAQ